MSFPYKTVLLLGATSGIGAALADKFIENGKKVIAVGRRQERLDEFIERHGEEHAGAVRFDITDLTNMDNFVKSTISRFPDIDCLFINSGIQQPVDLSKPEEVDMTKMQEELNTNFTSVIKLTIKFLPHLMACKDPASIIYTGSNLGYVPATGLAMYSSTKAALSSWSLCLRDQLRKSNVKVIEISPPLVQSELHDYVGVEKGRAMGIPVKDFADEAYRGLAEGKDQVVVGCVGVPPFDEVLLRKFNDIVANKRSLAENLGKVMRGEKPSW